MPCSSSPAASWRLEKPGFRDAATARVSTSELDLGALELGHQRVGLGLLVADGEQLGGGLVGLHRLCTLALAFAVATAQSFNFSIIAIAAAGARTLPSWIT